MPAPFMSDPRGLLRIYLNDHLAGSAGGINLARRCARSNRGTALGAFLEELVPQILEDRKALETLLAAFGFPADRLKLAAAIAAERAGRLKPNGRLRGYSPLSRLVELEGLYAGVDLKQRLWRVVRHLAADQPEMAAIDAEALIARAETQLTELERHRLQAAADAFT